LIDRQEQIVQEYSLSKNFDVAPHSRENGNPELSIKYWTPNQSLSSRKWGLGMRKIDSFLILGQSRNA